MQFLGSHGTEVLSQMFETVMGAIIAFNIVLMVVETNADATGIRV